MNRTLRTMGLTIALCLLLSSLAGAQGLRAPGPNPDCDWVGQFEDLVEVLRAQRQEMGQLNQQIHALNRELASRLPAVRRTRDFALMRQLHALRASNLELRVQHAELVRLRHQAWGVVLEGRELEDSDLIRTGLEQVIAVNLDVLDVLAGVLSNVQAMLDLVP